MPALTEKLSEIVGSEFCLATREELFVYECDGLTLDSVAPFAVVLPSTASQVADVVRACREAGHPVVPRGAGTGLSGGARPVEGAVIIECSRMDRIIEVDFENRFAVVQPGVVNAELSSAIVQEGLFYAPDPSSQQACTIGGNVAENSGGPHTLKYGTTTNHVLGLEIVLSDGERLHLGSAAGRSREMDLLGVVVGSEGTLGIVTEITVRLTPIPEGVETILAIFDTTVDACLAVGRIIRSGLVPAALEIVDQRTINAVEDSLYAAGLPRDAGAILIAEVDGAACSLDSEVARVKACVEAERVRAFEVAQGPEQRNRFWRARKGAFGAMGRLAPDLYVHDAVVPRAKLPEVIEQVCAIGDRYKLKLSNVFHAGDGNLHPNISFDRRDPAEVERVMAAGREILETCVAAGGVITGEHGIGVEKRDFMHLVFEDKDMLPMLHVRDAFDPDRICNPTKIFPTTRFCSESNPKARGYDRVPLG